MQALQASVDFEIGKKSHASFGCNTDALTEGNTDTASA